jgi:chemotaxis signal transduction protein
MEPKKKRQNTAVSGLPALDDLIGRIDRQIEKMPHPYAADGFEAFLGSQLGVFKKRGMQFIRFELSDAEFALPLENAVEITYVPDITPLPNLPLWVLGICNIRGDIVSVVDLKQILQLKPAAAVATNMIIVHDQDLTTAIMADKIMGMFFDGDQDRKIKKGPKSGETCSRFVQSTFVFEQRQVHLLDPKTLMTAIGLLTAKSPGTCLSGDH